MAPTAALRFPHGGMGPSVRREGSGPGFALLARTVRALRRCGQGGSQGVPRRRLFCLRYFSLLRLSGLDLG